jgi:hypothetical protein
MSCCHCHSNITKSSSLSVARPSQRYVTRQRCLACLQRGSMLENRSQSVWFFNPVVGMLLFMVTCIAALVCSGIFLPSSELFWPFKVFFYILPLPAYARSAMYTVLIAEDFFPCTDPLEYDVCVNSTLGADVLESARIIVPLISSDNTVASDVGILLSIAASFRLLYILGVCLKAPLRQKL